jgi:hypothetical protein
MRHAFRTIPLRSAVLCGAAVLFAAGCSKKADNTMNFKSAIDSYYSAHPACLWSDEVKFPLQVATADASKTAPYDALVDQGLLVRTTVERKKLIVMSQQANDYDLSDKGRSAWTADTAQPGFGNFCYGHRKVSGIDSSTPTNDQLGATTQIAYHYSFSDAPDWAKAAETQSVFPQLRTDLSGPIAAQATLTDTANGWQVSSTPDAPLKSAPMTAADGKIVQ